MTSYDSPILPMLFTLSPEGTRTQAVWFPGFVATQRSYLGRWVVGYIVLPVALHLPAKASLADRVREEIGVSYLGIGQALWEKNVSNVADNATWLGWDWMRKSPQPTLQEAAASINVAVDKLVVILHESGLI